MARSEINYDNYKVKAFLDTNIILEGRPLADLPWQEIDADGPIIALLTLTAIKEVDAHKQDGRVGERARAFNRLIAPVAAGGAPIVIRESKPRVELALSHSVRIPWHQYDNLDPADGDSCIVAEVLNAKDMNADGKLLVSHDIKPIIFASDYNVRTLQVSDNWLRQPEPHPKDRENQKLRNRVAEFEKSQPEFEIEIDLPDGEPVRVTRINELTGAERDQIERKIVAANPRQNQQLRGYGALTGLDSFDVTYNDRFDKYRKRIPAYVANYEERIERLFNQTRVRIAISNTGRMQAEHLLVDVHVSSGWIHDRYVYSSPGGPKVPKPRDNRFLVPELIRNIPFVPPRVGRHEVAYKDTPSWNTSFSATCEDFRHGQSWIFDGVLGIDAHAPETKIIVTISASNCRGQRQEVRSIARMIDTTALDTVVDFESRKLLVDMPLMHVIRSKDYENLIDFNAFNVDEDDEELSLR